MLRKFLIFMAIAVSMVALIACGETSTTNAPTTTGITSTTTVSSSSTTSVSTGSVTTTVTTATPITGVTTTDVSNTSTDVTTIINTGPANISYQGSALADGTVGVIYSQSIGTATGTSGITYSLKAGSELPNGLSLVGSTISGTPTTAQTKQFVIVANAVNAIAPVEATFTIEIVEAGPKTYIYEAEYVDLTDVWGSGWSNTATEWQMVVGDGESTPTSNGFYVAYFVPQAGVLKFPFTSDAAGTGKLSFSMVSEYAKDFFGVQAMLLEPSLMTLKINGVTIDYSVLIRAENQPTNDFDEYVFLEEFAILAGENIIEISMPNNNDYFPARAGGGPNVDYMKIESELNLVMDTYISSQEDILMLRGY